MAIRLASPAGVTLELAIDGTTLVILEGKKTTKRKFVSADHARTQLDKLVAAKLAEGFTAIAEPTEMWPPPDAVDDLSVAADDRERRGDPRGAITAMQLELSRREPRDTELIETCLAAIAKHAEVVFGELAKHVVPTLYGRGVGKKPVTIDFQRGYFDAVTMSGNAKLPIATAYAALRANPLATYLRSLEVRTASTVSRSFHYFDLVAAIAKHGRFEQLRRLSLGNVPTSPTWRINLGDLTAIVQPPLEVLHLRGAKLVLGSLPPTLRELSVEGNIPSTLLALIRASKIEHLTLRASAGRRELLPVVVAAALTPGTVRSLTLNGFAGDNGAADLGHELSRIPKLDLAANGIPPDDVQLLRDRMPNAVLTPQILLRDIEETRYDGIRE